jgi:hypothetical protein
MKKATGVYFYNDSEKEEFPRRSEPFSLKDLTPFGCDALAHHFDLPLTRLEDVRVWQG